MRPNSSVSDESTEMPKFKTFREMSIELVNQGDLPLEFPPNQKSHPADPNEPEKDCSDVSSTCGWAFYETATKDVDYYLKNTCYCPGEKVCIRLEDDVSLKAWVYKCLAEGNLLFIPNFVPIIPTPKPRP